MAALPPGTITLFAVFILILLCIVYVYFKNSYRHWEKRNINFVNPVFPFGNAKGIRSKETISQIIGRMYLEKKGEKLVGFWVMGSPAIIVRDTEIIGNILRRDFNYFSDKAHGVSSQLFYMNGQNWKNAREKFQASFSSKNLRRILPNMVAVGKVLKHVLQSPAERDTIVDMKDIVERYTNDVIASVVFGLEESSSLENPNTEFRLKAKRLISPSMGWFMSNILHFRIPGVQTGKNLPSHLTEYFITLVNETMKQRHKGESQREDYLQVLLCLDEDTLSVPQQKSQRQVLKRVLSFLTIGIGATSSTIQLALYELALEPNIQKRLHRELDHVLKNSNGEISYEAIQAMLFLDQVVSETLRKYPMMPSLWRICTKTYNVPGTRVTLHKGDTVAIPVLGLHYDPRYFYSPNMFDPDRFLTAQKMRLNEFTYLPFGDGPRDCVAHGFAHIQVKVALISILQEYLVEICPETPIPLQINNNVDFIRVKGKLHLRLSTRSQRKTCNL